MATKMSIHKALSELKTLDKRIIDTMRDVKFIGMYQEDKKLVDRITAKEEFEETAKARTQAIYDLIKRKATIKAAVVRSNSDTIVEIDGIKLTVADAITTKESVLELKKELLNTMLKQYREVTGLLNRRNEEVDSNCDKLLAAAMVDKTKAGADVIKNITDPYRNSNEWKLCDPLGLEKRIYALKEEIDNFESSIDVVLSESNSVTFIEV